MALLSSAIQYGTHAARPAAGIAGRLYGESDTGNLYRDNGATWDQIATTGGGGGGATDANGVTAPPTTGWVWQNQGAATITNAADGLWLYCAADSADVWKLRMLTAPSPPYSVIAEIDCSLPGANFASYGLAVNKTGTGLAIIGVINNGSAQLFAAFGDTTHITPGGTLVSNGWNGLVRWLKIDVPASGNLTFSYSIDGVNWIAYASGANAYASAETVGFGIDPRNGTFSMGALLRSWSAA